MDEAKCAVCHGEGTIELLGSECPFCNGTGESNKSAKSYLDSHICQCIFLDRKNVLYVERIVIMTLQTNPKYYLVLNRYFLRNRWKLVFLSMATRSKFTVKTQF